MFHFKSCAPVLIFLLTACDIETSNNEDDNQSNQAPTVSINTDNLTVAEKESITLTAIASDKDGKISQYLWSQTSGLEVNIMNKNDKNAQFTAPSVTQNSDVQLQLLVTDDKNATATATVTITIINTDTDTDTNTGTLIWPNEQSSANSDQWLRDHHDEITELRPRILAIDTDSKFTPEQAKAKALKSAAAIAEGSRYHGYKNPNAPKFLNPQIVRFTHLREPAVLRKFFGIKDEKIGELEPIFTQEFADHIGWKDPNNPGRNMNLCELFEKGHINEVWTSGYPSIVFEAQARQQVYDNNMQPIPGKFNNCANGCSDFGQAGQCKVTVRVMGINPYRGAGCDVHSNGHAMESMGRVIPYYGKVSKRFWGFGLKELYPDNNVSINSQYFCSYGDTPCFDYPSANRMLAKNMKYSPFEISDWGKSCGNVHFAPNSTFHYDYEKSNGKTASNTCENYGLSNGNDGMDKRTLFSYETIRQYNENRDYNDCGGGWQIYMRQSMPGYKNQAKDESGNPMKNWWPFFYY